MNLSIRKQLTFVFIGLVAGMFLLNYLINTFFLEDFYYLNKQKALVEAFELLNGNISQDATISDETKSSLDDICDQNNISFVVTDGGFEALIYRVTGQAEYRKLLQGRVNGYVISLDLDATVLKKTDQYTIQKKFDPEMGTDYLESWGTLDGGYYFLMRIPSESIRDSVRISNDFIKYICIVGILFTAGIVWYVSKRITRPLNELTELSKRMADLDFGVRYTGGGKNEVGQLGEHFNRMSENLEKTYSQLMTANNELQRDIEKKTKMEERRQEFLSNVSHELKTPIALIQGYAEGLKECINDDAESREFYCDVIMDEASRMNNLVRKLLTLNELEAGEEQVVMSRFDIVPLIRNKIQSVTLMAQQKEAEVLYWGPDSAPVWGDEFKAEEVITNYLSNALNHVEGERKIEIRVTPGQTKVRISVFNTGQKIPEQDLKLIWDKFYKVDKARTREYGGSGVGLSIVKAIMDSFHQQYGVKNYENGVAFWFELESGNQPLHEEKDA